MWPSTLTIAPEVMEKWKGYKRAMHACLAPPHEYEYTHTALHLML